MSTPTTVGRILGYCDHSGAVLHRNAGNNGIGLYCDTCQTWVTKQMGYDRHWLGKDHPALAGVVLESLPTVGLRTYRKCQGPCGVLTQCQLHHIAPRKFFDEECEDWPMLWLCPPCHGRWHAVVTPGLCTAYDPLSHAKQLIDYLGLDRAAALTKSLIARGQAARAGAA